RARRVELPGDRRVALVHARADPPPPLLLLAALAALRGRERVGLRRARRDRDDPELHRVWSGAVNAARSAYHELVEGVEAGFTDVPERTLRRKMARQAARSVLPNATETKIFITGNARALRHFIELRGSEHAEVEIRKVAVAMLRIMQQESPNLFGDYTLEPLA